jgi:hypothetical protein
MAMTAPELLQPHDGRDVAAAHDDGERQRQYDDHQDERPRHEPDDVASSGTPALSMRVQLARIRLRVRCGAFRPLPASSR